MRNRVVLIMCCAVTCVGQAECSDGEDEKLSRCTASEDELKFCDLDKQEFPCEAGPAKTKCIPFSEVCDGVQDCPGGRDENTDICGGEVASSLNYNPTFMLFQVFTQSNINGEYIHLFNH